MIGEEKFKPMNEVVIAGYLRTAQSRSRPNAPDLDWFGSLRADELLARLVAPVLQRSKTGSEEIDDLIVGSALGVGEQWTFGGRTPVFLADLSPRTAARFVDQQCGSGMAAVQIGFMEIATGFADVVLACGMEHMTRVPMGATLFENGTLSINEALYSRQQYRHWDMHTTMNMGLTAEKLFERTNLDRQDLDVWAVRSHQQAVKAREAGFFKDEILPIEALQSDGRVKIVDQDQSLRPETDLKAVGGLKPVFRPDGVITAGNASPLSAGAAAMVLMSAQTAQKKGIVPLGVIRSIGFAGVDPTLMGIGPLPAIRMALGKAGIEAEAIDYWEINEAFSVVVLNCIAELDIQPKRVNVNGGAIAIGHPLGATGIRLVGTLARILSGKKARYGCAAACIGGGQGIAVIIESLVSK
jgi:acetyl-CoA acetyltransferase family protein